MKKLFSVVGALAFLAVLPIEAQAGASCTDKTTNLDVGYEGEGGRVSKRIPLEGNLYGKDLRVSNEDCFQQNLNEEFNKAAALGAIVEFYPDGDGFHANVVAANGDLNAEATAVGLNLMYTHDLADGPFDSLRIGGSAGSVVDGEDQIYALTVGINWGGSPRQSRQVGGRRPASLVTIRGIVARTAAKQPGETERPICQDRQFRWGGEANGFTNRWPPLPRLRWPVRCPSPAHTRDAGFSPDTRNIDRPPEPWQPGKRSGIAGPESGSDGLKDKALAAPT